MANLSFDRTNPGPRAGDVIISEVHYHPDGQNAQDLEIIELANRTKKPINVGQWQIANAVEYTLPSGAVVPVETALILVGFDPIQEPSKKKRIMEY